ncbi:MAG: hypothetical protein WCF95_01875 [bacterium]
MSGILEELQELKLQKKIDKLAKKYKNKKVILYAAGMYFDEIIENFDLSGLNIIGIADKNFDSKTLEHKGFKAFAPSNVKEQNPDIVLICAYDVEKIEDYFEDVLFPQYGKFKYKALLEQSLWECLFG